MIDDFDKEWACWSEKQNKTKKEEQNQPSNLSFQSKYVLMFVEEKMKGKGTPHLLKPLLLSLKTFVITWELLRNAES